jgi:dipeptide/tripeptide permease
MIIIFAAGSLNPLIRSFGGDQYKLPDESESLAFYFSICFLMLNAGSAIARFVNPMIRENVQCFDGQECYPMIFGVTSLILIVGLVILISGKSFMTCVPPGGNMFGRVCACVVVR